MRERLTEFQDILIPGPIDDYSSGRVLTMEYESAHTITKFSPIVRLEIDGDALAEELFRAYLHQILVVGVFHADPHPGNVFLTEDHKIALLDLGMVGHFGPAMQDLLLKLLISISEGNSDRAAELAERIGEAGEDYDGVKFRRDIADLVSQQRTANLADLQVGKVLMD